MTLTSEEAANLSRLAHGRTVKTIQDELLTLDEGRRAQAGAIANSATGRWVPWYFRALRGEESPIRAIKIMCYHCVGWDRSEVHNCTAKGCPLWAYRPGQEDKDE